VTVGSGASLSSLNFINQAERVAGSYRLRSLLNAGVASDRADQLLTRIPDILANNQLDHIHVQVGTNDAGQSITWQNYATAMTSIATLIKNAGVSVSMGTVIPRISTSTTINAFIQQYNLWLTLWCPKQGIPLADTWAAIADPATGGLAAAYDSGDGIHPNDAGHLALAKSCAPVVVSRESVVPWPGAAVQAMGLIDDPLSTVTTGWTASGAASTFSHTVSSAGYGELPVNNANWRVFNVDNSAGGSAANKTWSYTLSSSKYAANDEMAICFYVGHDDISQASSIKIQIANGGTAFSIVVDTTNSVNNPGPAFEPFNIPASPTTITVQATLNSAARANTTAYLGLPQVFNLTAGGFDAYL
jgi:lysophospholipase L1-like esterase